MRFIARLLSHLTYGSHASHRRHFDYEADIFESSFAAIMNTSALIASKHLADASARPSMPLIHCKRARTNPIVPKRFESDGFV